MAATHTDNHGKSVAGWTTMWILMLAAALIAVGVAWGIHALQIAGVVVAVIGAATGKILVRAGFGSDPIQAPPLPDGARQLEEHTSHVEADQTGTPTSKPQTAQE